jgi:ABC-type phosphate/phosphonate transport system permease subunit
LQLHSLCLHGLHVALGVVRIGFSIQTDLRMMNCRAAACVLLVLIALVMAVDWISSQIHKYLI